MIEKIIFYLILSAVAFQYVRFTWRFHKRLQRSVIFERTLKYTHLVLIWLIPFGWAIILNSIMKGLPGSHETEMFGETGGPWGDVYTDGGGGDAGGCDGCGDGGGD